jgi:acylphosphatase
MRQREFEITISKDGSVEVHVKGYKGKRCLDAVKMFEQIVGKQKSQRLTSEYYDPEEEVQYRVEQRH